MSTFVKNNFKDIPNFLRSLNIFGSVDYIEDEFYYIIYPEQKISRNDRKELKESGWVLTKHTRSKKEMWIWYKK